MNATELAQLADHWSDCLEKRLAADKVAAALKEEENRAKALLIEQMRTHQLTAIGGKAVVASLKETKEPVVKNWALLYRHLLDTQDFSLLEKRIGRAAVKERWSTGAEVPGVESYSVFNLSKSGVKNV